MEDIKNVTEEDIKAAKRAYKKAYYAKPENKDKRRIYNARYWAKKAKELAEQQENIKMKEV